MFVAALADAFENDVFDAESSGDAPVGQKFEMVRKDGDFGQLGFGVLVGFVRAFSRHFGVGSAGGIGAQLYQIFLGQGHYCRTDGLHV